MRPLSPLGSKVIVKWGDVDDLSHWIRGFSKAKSKGSFFQLFVWFCMVPCSTRQKSVEAQRMSCSSCNSNDIKSRGVWQSRRIRAWLSLITKALRNYIYKAKSPTLISSLPCWGRLTGRDVHMFGKEGRALSDSCCFASTMSLGILLFMRFTFTGSCWNPAPLKQIAELLWISNHPLILISM